MLVKAMWERGAGGSVCAGRTLTVWSLCGGRRVDHQPAGIGRGVAWRVCGELASSV